METTKNHLSIFNFTDYRLYLKAYYAEQKKSNRHFSYRGFGERAGVSASLLKDLIEGRRNLSVAIMHKYASVMKLSKRATRYFELLVIFAQSKSNSEKNSCFGEMVRLRGQSGIHFIGEDHYTFFSKWYHSPIREMVTLPHFVEDYDLIAQQLEPSITSQEVEASIGQLISIGLLKRNACGDLQQTDGVISSEYEMASVTLRGFHSQMIHLADRALEEIPREEREISSITVGVSDQMLLRMKERIRIFKEELLSMIVEDTSDSQQVCQLNFQLFPLVQSKGEDQ